MRVRWKDMPVRRAASSFGTESSGDEGDLVWVSMDRQLL
jgi:hypothetical protein